MEFLFGFMIYTFLGGLTGRVYSHYHHANYGLACVAACFWPITLPIHIGVWMYNELM